MATQLSERLAKLGATQSGVAALSGIGSAAISLHMNGGASLTGDKVRRLEERIAQMEELARVTAPLPLDWSNVTQIRSCLDSLETGLLRICVFVADPSPKERAFAVRFRNGQYFVRRLANGDVLKTDFPLKAEPLTEELAAAIISRLNDVGHLDLRAVENQYFEDPSCELEQVWTE